MPKFALVAIGAFLIGLAAPGAAKPIVVAELFTAQGCSSCVKSGEVVAQLAKHPRVLPLTFAVDYWDYLGWRDTFARPEFADRQRAYMKALGLREVYTPQLVVDGRLQAAAANPDEAVKLVAAAARELHDPPDMAFVKGGRIAVGSGPAPHEGAEVWLIRYDPLDQSISVKRGENRGQIIVERNVVRQLVRLGSWSGKPKVFRLPAPTSAGLSTLVLVQAIDGGRILGAKSP